MKIPSPHNLNMEKGFSLILIQKVGGVEVRGTIQLME
jgi:hypothetical protein